MVCNTMSVLAVALLAAVAQVSGHGYANDPPSRSSMWRFGYSTPVNYEDNQLWCGGFQVRKMNFLFFNFNNLS
jgi:predicted carbohydrate-binding protein with CBM5 and CBM33 domain